MSYLNATVAPADRAKAAVSVIAVHALLATGVVVGLAVTTEVLTRPENPESFFIPIDVPPPPKTIDVPPDNTVITTPPSAPLPPIDLSRETPIEIEIARDEFPPITTTIPNLVGPIAPRVIEPALAAYTPTGPIPANPMSRWVTNDDYSRNDLIRGREGTARYRLVVSSDGRVDACEIVASTGHATLDRTTCRMIERRARFAPATNNRGESVVGTYTGSVTWQIPG